ncbi:MAG: hypothetical protein ACJAU0_001413 [Flavobacteriales bacterium]|jgi:hypothetical protein
MKTKNLLIAITLFLIPAVIVAQTPPPLGSVDSYVLFSSVGAVTNLGVSQITGDMGTNSGAVSGFGNVNGQMHIANATTTQCAIDLGIAYTNLSGQIPGATLGLVLGAGQTLLPNVYLVPGAASLLGTLTLDGCGDPDACFVFQVNGAFTTGAISSIVLTNGAKACNVFWRVNGQMSMATKTSFKGTIIVAGAVPLGVGVHLEGRALCVSGAISVSSLTADIPLGCADSVFTGPSAPALGSLECFALLTADGVAINTGSTTIAGDIGINNGTISGFDPLGTSGIIHSTPDAITAQASLDLSTLHTYLSSLPTDITLLYPVLFGHSQVLTPNVYTMYGATVLTDTLFLDARGVTDAVFVIRIMGALTTGAAPQVVLVGGAQSNNVFWQVEGAVTISSSSNFKGIIVANNAAIVIHHSVLFNGRAFSTNGNITTHNVNIIGTNTVRAGSSAPSLCVNTALTTITHGTTGATGIGSATDLPEGVTAAWSANTISINGTPTTSGIFNYTIQLTGGCGSANATGTITVNTDGIENTASTPSSTPVSCINNPLANITHTTTGATGIGSATDLPEGLTASWSANTITISGTPIDSGTFNYSVPLTGGCGAVNATGTITVILTSATTSVTEASSTPTLCINTDLINITHTTTGATGIGFISGLPNGFTATWSANTITISGTALSSGTFDYSIRLMGGCGCDHIYATGTITVILHTVLSAGLTTISSTICHGMPITLSGNVTAIGAWTLELSNGQTTTGVGNEDWNIVITPTGTETYGISSIIDTNACIAEPSGSTTITLIAPTTSISYDNETATCNVNQNGWVHYYHASGRLIASINSAGQNLGDVSVTSYLDATNQFIPACPSSAILHETAVMERHWVITPSIQPTLPVQVRLPFEASDYNNLESAANSNSTGWDDVFSINDIKLTKYSGPLNVNSNATDNCVSNGGSGGATVHAQSANGATSSYSIITNSKYVDFTISGFSELWINGGSPISLLPIELLSFTAEPADNHVQLNWVTASETNNSYFTIERTSDHLNFETIAIIDGAGNSTQVLNYLALDNTPLNGLSYYRLKQTDYNGDSDYSNLVPVEFNGINDFIFNVYPNPNNGERFNIQTSQNEVVEVLVIVYDMLGKEIYSKVITTNKNHSDVYAIEPSEKLNPGAYLITASYYDQTYSKKLIVH